MNRVAQSVSPFLQQLPKVELHLHLEGAIPPETLLGVFRRHGNTEMACLEDVLRLYQHRDFYDFLAHFRTILEWLRDADDLEPITYDVLSNLARQNVRYAEVIFSPGTLLHFHGLDPDRVLDAIQRGYARARSEHTIEIALLLDLTRNVGLEYGSRMARFAAGAQDRGVIGITLGGNERDFPAAPYAEIYQWARDQGLRVTAHAGEAAGPESVWDCIRLLGVERIGHGVRMEDDPRLAEYVVEHGIAIECCPWSNVLTGAVESLEAHPVRRWFERGVRLSINSDDPTLFGTDITRELARLQAAHGFSDGEILHIMAQAVQMSFLPEGGKARLRRLLAEFAVQNGFQTL